jgi:hypothetical protein
MFSYTADFTCEIILWKTRTYFWVNETIIFILEWLLKIIYFRFAYGLSEDRSNMAEGMAMALNIFEDSQIKHWKNKYVIY